MEVWRSWMPGTTFMYIQGTSECVHTGTMHNPILTRLLSPFPFVPTPHHMFCQGKCFGHILTHLFQAYIFPTRENEQPDQKHLVVSE